MDIKLSGPVKRRIEWVMRAVSEDNTRPVLTMIHIHNGTMEASDGFRAHRWKWELGCGGKKSCNALEELNRLPDGLYSFVISEDAEGKPILSTAGSSETKYPDLDKVTTKQEGDTIPMKGSGKPATAHIYANNYFLKDAMNLRGPDGYPAVTHLTITGKVMYVNFVNGVEAGGTATATVMLLYTDQGTAYIETVEPDEKPRETSLF